MKQHIAAKATSLIVAAVFGVIGLCRPAAILAVGYCPTSGYVGPSSDEYDRWYAGQCLEGSQYGIDGYLRLSGAAFGAGDVFDADYLSISQPSGWVQVGERQISYGPPAVIKVYFERTVDEETCKYELPPFVAMPPGRSNYAAYVMFTGSTYVPGWCGIAHADEYAGFFGSYAEQERPVAYGLLAPGGGSASAFEEVAFRPAIPPALTGVHRFGLNDAGAYQAGYALHLYDGIGWSQWTQLPTMIGWSTLVVPGTSAPPNPLAYGPMHSWDSFKVTDTR